MDYLAEHELNAQYVPVSPEKVRQWWASAYEKVPVVDTTEINIIGGAIIPLWERLKSHREAKLRVLRVSTDEGTRIVGIEIPKRRLGAVLRAIGVSSAVKAPQEVFKAVLDEGDRITLVSNMALKLSTHAKAPTIELECSDPKRFEEFRRLGLINEQIKWKQCFFIPTDAKKGLDVLAALLKRYPVMADKEQKADSLPIKEDVGPGANKVLVLDDWICAPEEEAEPEAPEVITDVLQPTVAIQGVAEVLEFASSELSDNGSTYVMPVPVPAGRNSRRKTQPIVEQGLLFDLA